MPRTRFESSPDGIRVWRGFRAQDFVHNRPGFEDKVRRIFVPQTAQQMTPLGLCAYFPALLPDSFDASANDVHLKIPDEIALVVYPSFEAYKNAIDNTTAGRAYGLLHWPVFNSQSKATDPVRIPPSKSDYPLPWVDAWQWDRSYSLLDNPLNWRHGVTELLVARPKPELLEQDFQARLADAIREWRHTVKPTVRAGILCVCRDYLLYWENRRTRSASGSCIAALKSLTDVVYLQSMAKRCHVPPAFTAHDPGVDMQSVDFLDVRVARIK